MALLGRMNSEPESTKSACDVYSNRVEHFVPLHPGFLLVASDRNKVKLFNKIMPLLENAQPRGAHQGVAANVKSWCGAKVGML